MVVVVKLCHHENNGPVVQISIYHCSLAKLIKIILRPITTASNITLIVLPYFDLPDVYYIFLKLLQLLGLDPQCFLSVMKTKVNHTQLNLFKAIPQKFRLDYHYLIFPF